jgi:tetratricopeptide (TPR) repeat protein
MRLLVPIFLVRLLYADTIVPHIHAAVEAFQAGKVAQKSGKLDSAAGLFQRAIDIEPTFMDARKAIIQVNLDGGHKMEGAKALTQLLEIEPDDAKSRILLGTLLLELKETDRALAQFSAALKLAPADAGALLGFAQAASQLGMEDRAKEAFDRGRKLYPSDQRFARPALTKPVN